MHKISVWTCAVIWFPLAPLLHDLPNLLLGKTLERLLWLMKVTRNLGGHTLSSHFCRCPRFPNKAIAEFTSCEELSANSWMLFSSNLAINMAASNQQFWHLTASDLFLPTFSTAWPGCCC